MTKTITIGTPPLGEQTHPILVGKIKDDIYIQADGQYIKFKEERLRDLVTALQQRITYPICEHY